MNNGAPRIMRLSRVQGIAENVALLTGLQHVFDLDEVERCRLADLVLRYHLMSHVDLLLRLMA